MVIMAVMSCCDGIVMGSAGRGFVLGFWAFGWREAGWGFGAEGGLALSVSDREREGRLVDALAARGDEGRDTLR